MQQADTGASRVAIVTGGAARIGAAIVERLHADGYRVLIHYRNSASAAGSLASRCNAVRPDSAIAFAADLADHDSALPIVNAALDRWHRVDLLVNNASEFFPTPLGTITQAVLQQLFAANFAAPLFLSQAAWPELRERSGSVVNIVDIYAQSPLKEHTVYCTSKAALEMLTKSLALEFAPHVNVNGVAPGAILWPEGPAGLSDKQQQQKLSAIPLQRKGEPSDIAGAVAYLASPAASYITGQIISIDGGRSL